MTRLKAPLFGMDAHGTVGGAVTYNSRKHLDIAKSIPTHPATYTTPQLQQRFLYRIGCGLWKGLTPAQQAAYKAQAVGLPLIAMNVFLREWLTTTPNLILALPLVAFRPTSARDLGPNGWDASLVLPSWEPYGNNYTLRFDGVDDYAQLPTVNDLALQEAAWTFLFRINLLASGGSPVLFSKQQGATNGWQINTGGAQLINFRIWLANVQTVSTSSNWALPIGTPVTIGISFASSHATIFVNGVDETVGDPAHPAMPATVQRAKIGRRSDIGAQWLNAHLHWILGFDRALTAREHAAIASMYPPPITP